MLVMQPLLPVQWVKVVNINYRLYEMSIEINIYYTLYKFIGMTVIKSPGEHNHAPDPLEVDVNCQISPFALFIYDLH